MIQRQPISVSTLSNYIKQIFDAESMLFDLDVIGEISSYNISGKNAFFTLKDEESLLNCVLFNATIFYRPKIGEKVIIHGSPKYYSKAGKLNFNAISIKPFGEGDIYKRFLELKNKLEKEGLFDIKYKKPIPRDIRRIGVITSESGAVIHDILNVLKRRNSGQDIVLYPIKVQGVGSDIEIAKGLRFFSEYENVDAVIVGRGGGSDEDLQNFNSEIVARAVFDCKKFVLSAVGHETNFTICDYVADLRASTPTAAAELLTKDGGERKQTLDLIMKNIISKHANKLSLEQNKLDKIIDYITNSVESKFQNIGAKILLIEENLKKSNPTQILKKGFVKIEKDDKRIKSVLDLKQNDEISICFYDGTAQANIIKVEDKNGL